MESKPGEGQFEVLDTSEESDASDGSHKFEQKNEDRHPAAISIRSTSTSNPKNPRTLRAGYEYATGTLTVIFDDHGKAKWWNYYNVPVELWDGFRNAKSKGRFLISSGLNTWDDMGEPNMAAMSPQYVAALGKTRDVQQALGGRQSRRLSGPMMEAAQRKAALNRNMRGLGQ